jgi:hypothetical protein
MEYASIGFYAALVLNKLRNRALLDHAQGVEQDRHPDPEEEQRADKREGADGQAVDQCLENKRPAT